MRKEMWGKLVVGLLLCSGLVCYGWLGSVTLAGAATTWKVCQEGWCDYTSIKTAIEAPTTVDGDTVLVSGGTYVERINFGGKAITVQSVNGAASTIIDGNANGSVVTFENSEVASSVLDGFTITNGSGNNEEGVKRGGGIYCVNSSSPTIANCTIRSNNANNGGGIWCSSSPTITNCTISANTGYSGGGGIYCYDSSPTITNCDININNGAGIFCDWHSSPTITDCTITGNKRSGIYCNYSSPEINNCTISNNDAGFGGGIYCYGSSPSIINCTISGNTSRILGGGGILCWDNSSPEITNCTISSNYNYGYAGGGIFCEYSSSPSITDCIIRNNYSGWLGGGIYCGMSSSPTIDNCQISNNTSRNGAGIACKDASSPSITNCTISSNRAYFLAGGIGCYESSPIISGCRIDNNRALYGGGVGLGSSSSKIINCTITGNTASMYASGIGSYDSSPTIINCTIGDNATDDSGGGMGSYSSEGNGFFPTVVNSILWGDTNGGSPREVYLYDANSSIAITYSDVQGGDPGNPGSPWLGLGNIDADPQFVGGNNYHLTADSPCIDRGRDGGDIPIDDIDGDVRPWDMPAPNNPTAYDMGSDEYVGESAEPIVTISTDQPSYATGDTMEVTLEIIAGSAPTTADLYIRLKLPNGAYRYYPNMSSSPKPVKHSWTVTDFGPAVFFSYTFGGGAPSGGYTWQTALTEPGTSTLIGELSTASFTFSP